MTYYNPKSIALPVGALTAQPGVGLRDPVGHRGGHRGDRAAIFGRFGDAFNALELAFGALFAAE